MKLNTYSTIQRSFFNSAILLGILLGFLAYFAFPSYDYHFLLIIALAILYLKLTTCKTNFFAFKLVYFFFIVTQFLTTNWTTNSLTYYGEFHPIVAQFIYLLAGFIVYTLAGLAALLYKLIAIKNEVKEKLIFRILNPLSFAVIFTLFEYLRGQSVYFYPWINFSYFFDDTIFWSLLPYISLYGLHFVIALFSAFLGEFFIIIVNFFKKSKITLHSIQFILLFIILNITFFSLMKILQNNKSDVRFKQDINISYIQGNFDPKQKWSSPMSTEVKKFYLSSTQLDLNKKKTDLIILAESLFGLMNDEIEPLFKDLLKQVDTQKAIIYGNLARADNDDVYNLAIMLKNEIEEKKKNITADYYYKQNLVPFGEYFPLNSHIDWLPGYEDIQAGKNDEITYFEYQGLKIAMLICYEIIFPFYVSKKVEDADMLILLSDISWFGSHHMRKQFNSIIKSVAIENQIPTVSIVNSGSSVVYDHNGDDIAISDEKSTDLVDVRVKIPEKSSIDMFRVKLVLFILISIYLTSMLLFRFLYNPNLQEKINPIL